MYFSEFPKIFYDFPQDQTSTNLQILTDITANVRIRKQILENITLYDEYDIQEGETPEIIAEKVYGNAELHWVIMLANQRYDYLEDFPMTSHELQDLCVEKYGADKLDVIHHYERDGIIVEGVGVMKLPNTPSDLLKIIRRNDFIQGENARARVESVDAEGKKIVVLLDYGIFHSNDLVTLLGVRTDETSGQTLYTALKNFNVPTNGFTLNENYVAITNYTFEVRENEKKRRIKLISRDLIDQIIREFKELIKPR